MTANDHLQGQQRPSAEQVAWVFHHLIELYDEGCSLPAFDLCEDRL
jgi:hypothetical protein